MESESRGIGAKGERFGVHLAMKSGKKRRRK